MFSPSPSRPHRQLERPFSWLAIGLVCPLLLGGFIASLLPGSNLAAAYATTPAAEALILQAQAVAEIGNILPTDIASAGDGRLFLTSRPGLIYIVQPGGQLNPVPFLDIQDRVRSTIGEEGLIGLVFHPNYSQNRYFFVHYTDLNGDTVISRFRTYENDPNLANPASEASVLWLDQVWNVHKGGDLNFGPDGYLYAVLGDGSPISDLYHDAQNGQLLLGSMLRLDIDNGLPYTIPADNPFVADPNFRDELWAKGLRNPWRFSFDRLTGDLYIADLGHMHWEEINFLPAGSPGGQNYGWPCYEGNHPFYTDPCGPADSYDRPIYEYSHPGGCAIIGGYVYRGSQQPAIYGHYLFADICSGALNSLAQSQSGQWQAKLVGQEPVGWTSFGEAADGEIYAVGIEQTSLYHIQAVTVTLPAAVYLPLVIQ